MNCVAADSPFLKPFGPWLLGLIAAGLAGLFTGDLYLLLALLYAGGLWLGLVYFLHRQVQAVELVREAPRGVYEQGQLKTTFYLENESNFPLAAPLATDRLPFNRDFKSRARFPGLVYPGQVMANRYKTSCRAQFGRYTLGPTAIQLSDPLGVAKLKRTFERYQPITLYPQWSKLRWLPIYGGRRRFTDHTKSSSKTARGQDIYGLREYERGDPMRHIHWRSVAKHDELMVKQFEFPAARTVHVFLDLHHERKRGLGTHSTRQETAHLAASTAAYAIHAGHRVSFHARGDQYYYLPPRGGDQQLFSLLELLVDIRQEGETPLDELLTAELTEIDDQATVVLVIPTTRLDPEKYVRSLSVLQGRRASVVVLLIDDRGMVRFDGTAEDYERKWTLRELKHSFLAQGAWCRVIDPEQPLSEQFPPRESWVQLED